MSGMFTLWENGEIGFCQKDNNPAISSFLYFPYSNVIAVRYINGVEEVLTQEFREDERAMLSSRQRIMVEHVRDGELVSSYEAKLERGCAD